MISKPQPVDTAEPSTSTVGNCTLHISNDPNDTPVVKIIGEVDGASASKAYAAMWRASGSGKHSLIIDMKDMDFMDSSGLQALLRLREKLRSRKQELFLVAAKPQIKKLLRLTGFDKLFNLRENAPQGQAPETTGSSEK